MIPTVDQLASDVLTVRAADLFNPPGLTNFLGALQVDRDPVAIRSVNYPPLFGSDVPTGALFLNGEYVVGDNPPISFTWTPDRVVRDTTVGPFHITTTTVAPIGHTAAVVDIEVHNRGPAAPVELHLAVAGLATNQMLSLRDAVPPMEPSKLSFDEPRRAAVFVGERTGAASVQGLHPAPDRVDRNGLWATTELAAGERWLLRFVVALGATTDDAIETFDTLTTGPDPVAYARQYWNEELAAVVTPGNDRYSGHLPRLETDEPALRRLYDTGILGVIYFKRDNPHSVIGRAYDTLTPRYWPTITFLWDFSLSSTVHALLDPEPMRRQVEHWMNTDVHRCMGTSWLTGEGVGMWYSVNDYAMTRIVHDYLRWTGDLAWLDAPLAAVDGPTATPMEQLQKHARAWKQFATGNGLADYGGIGNLLECVSSYVHEVASLNAANAYNLRTVADLMAMRGSDPTDLRAEADDIVARIDELYVKGQGHFDARSAEGDRWPVRHCYDLLTVMWAIPDALDDQRRREMVAFFERELRTPGWMRALSNRDFDAPFSVRPDHQWNGAYTAWPSEVVRGLYRVGEGERAGAWLRELAAAANQGPFGQAHFIETAVPPHEGGARKAPPELPYITDWACSSGGSWTTAVIEGVFGVDATLDGISATPNLNGLDPDARLTGLSHQGSSYTVDASGLHAEGH